MVNCKLSYLYMHPSCFTFLALLDYVSRAYETEIRLSSARPSSVYDTIISVLNTWFSFKFWLFLPLGHTLGRFLNYFLRICSFSLTWDPMGAKISKGYSCYKPQAKCFKLFLNFLPTGPHKIVFGIFEILKLKF